MIMTNRETITTASAPPLPSEGVRKAARTTSRTPTPAGTTKARKPTTQAVGKPPIDWVTSSQESPEVGRLRARMCRP